MDNSDLLNLIPSMEQTREELSHNEIYRKEIAQEINKMNERIEKAKERGGSSTCWVVNKHEHHLRRMYRKKGYSFKPTGYVGGVMQYTEDICW
jgi:hypothetical protein